MHNSTMRNHATIVKDVGPGELAELTGAPITTVRSWAQRDSIPADHWLVLVSEGHCTADELMLGAARDKAA
jgi:hypothetical protein